MRLPAVLAAASCLAAVSAAAATGGGRVLFQSSAPGGGDTLYTMAQDGSGVRRLQLNVPGSAVSPDWAPDGRHVTFSLQVGTRSRSGPLTRTAETPRRCSTARGPVHPEWAASGKLIAFDTYDLLAYGDSAPGASNLFTVRADGTHVTQLTHFKAGGNRVSAATFTPDGRRILFTYQVGRSRLAGSIDTAGGAIRAPPTRYGGPVTHPRLSPAH